MKSAKKIYIYGTFKLKRKKKSSNSNIKVFGTDRFIWNMERKHQRVDSQQARAATEVSQRDIRTPAHYKTRCISCRELGQRLVYIQILILFFLYLCYSQTNPHPVTSACVVHFHRVMQHPHQPPALTSFPPLALPLVFAFPSVCCELPPDNSVYPHRAVKQAPLKFNIKLCCFNFPLYPGGETSSPPPSCPPVQKHHLVLM